MDNRSRIRDEVERPNHQLESMIRYRTPITCKCMISVTIMMMISPIHNTVPQPPAPPPSLPPEESLSQEPVLFL